MKRQAGLTGSCCRRAGHDEGEKEGSKGLPGRNSLSPLFAFFAWAVLQQCDLLVCPPALRGRWRCVGGVGGGSEGGAASSSECGEGKQGGW